MAIFQALASKPGVKTIGDIADGSRGFIHSAYTYIPLHSITQKLGNITQFSLMS